MAGVIGVDEAGRGPVLGSMFVAALAVPDRTDLPGEVADSKGLTDGTRRSIYRRLESDSLVETAVIEVPPAEIDSNPGGLLELVVDAFAAAIDGLDRPGWPAVLDAGEANVQRFARRVGLALDDDREVRAAVRADEDDPVVSAASIVAKEHRERHVEQLHERYGDVGSGYPADPATRAFLAAHVRSEGSLPACARRCWRTSRDLLAAAEQAELDRFVDGPRGGG